jgi:hypothetical protein
MPPEPTSLAEYGTPTVACGSVVVVTARADTFTVIDSVAVAVAAELSESLTCTMKPLVPAAAGRPLISPVAGARVSPGTAHARSLMHGKADLPMRADPPTYGNAVP